MALNPCDPRLRPGFGFEIAQLTATFLFCQLLYFSE